MKTLQEHYNAIKTGQGNKAQFVKQARLLFPEYFNQYTDFDTATNVLKSKQIISEAAGGVVAKGFSVYDWKKILAEETENLPKKGDKYENVEVKIDNNGTKAKKNVTVVSVYPDKSVLVRTEDGGDAVVSFNDLNKTLSESVKAVEKEISKEAAEANRNAFQPSDMKNADNVNFNEIMKGFYCEMKDEKNKDKTGDELKAMVVKNLAKDPLYYTKNGEFGTKGVGYTTEAPGLGEPKAPKGKHKSSGYGDLKENKEKRKLSLKQIDGKDKKGLALYKNTEDSDDLYYYDGKVLYSVVDGDKKGPSVRMSLFNITGLKENTDILDYYASTIEANNMTEDEAYAYLEDIGLPHFQINSIMNYVFPIKADKDIPSQGITESEQKLRSLIRNIIKEELNSDEYKNTLMNMEKPYYSDPEALDQIIKLYSTHIQSLSSIKNRNKQ